MRNQKHCPMKKEQVISYQGTGLGIKEIESTCFGICEQELCEWWNDSNCCCSISKLPWIIENLNNIIDSLNHNE